MSKVERVVHLCVGILFAWMGIGGLVIVGGLVVYGPWQAILFITPIVLFLTIAVSLCAYEAIQTFRTGRL